MDERQQAWKKAIQALLTRHGLSKRGAGIRVGRPSMRTYIADWTEGQIPQYRTAVDFLRHFPPDEAAECLRAAGYPIPDEFTGNIAKTDRAKEQQIAHYLIEKEAWSQEKVEQMFAEITEKGAL
jgi:hypothetical protein